VVLSGLLAVAGAATAIAALTTGVPAVDRMLDDMHEAQQQAHQRMPPGPPPGHEPLPPGVKPPPTPDLRPGPGSASRPIQLGPAHGVGRSVGVAYVSRDGMICFARAELLGGGDTAPGGVGCTTPRGIAKRLERTVGFVSGGGGARGSALVSYGVARADVERVRAFWAGRAVQAKLTERWKPVLASVPPLRLFVTVRPAKRPTRPVDADEVRRLSRPPRIELTLADGRVVELNR
jgi:hypothetical protein